MLFLAIVSLIFGACRILYMSESKQSARVSALNFSIGAFVFILFEFCSIMHSSLDAGVSEVMRGFFFGEQPKVTIRQAFIENLAWGQYGFSMRLLDILNVSWITVFKIDAIAVCFILLTGFITPICILVSWESVNIKKNQFYSALLGAEVMAICAFMVNSLFYFYIFFELAIIPLYFIIGTWGTKNKKSIANYYFLIFSLLGSILLLSAAVVLYTTSPSLFNEELGYSFSCLSNPNKIAVFSCLFLAFLIKIPSFPFYIWLPEAHVEAPTAGSIFLSGVVLKLGGYGVFRFILPITTEYIYYTMEWYILGTFVVSALLGSCLLFRQTDLKKIIAYSSVVHMNISMLSLFSGSYVGLQGALLGLISHGLVTTLLFLLTGMLYDRHGVRNILYYTGLGTTMPFFSVSFFFAFLANSAFPLTLNFVGEFLVFVGIFQYNIFIGVLSLISILMVTIYSFWVVSKMLFGNPYKEILQIVDVSRREFMCIMLSVVPIIFLGIFPNILLDTMYVNIYFEIYGIK